MYISNLFNYLVCFKAKRVIDVLCEGIAPAGAAKVRKQLVRCNHFRLEMWYLPTLKRRFKINTYLELYIGRYLGLFEEKGFVIFFFVDL